MIYLIKYTLKNPNKFNDYDQICNILKTAEDWCVYSQNMWFIKSNHNISFWFNKIMPLLDKYDEFFMVQIFGNYGGYLNKKALDWLRQYFPKSNEIILS